MPANELDGHRGIHCVSRKAQTSVGPRDIPGGQELASLSRVGWVQDRHPMMLTVKSKRIRVKLKVIQLMYPSNEQLSSSFSLLSPTRGVQ